MKGIYYLGSPAKRQVPVAEQIMRQNKFALSGQTLISNDGQDVFRTDAEKGGCSIPTLVPIETVVRLVPKDETPAPAWSMPTATFRARQAFLSLTPAERQAVTNRRRFYRLPWLKPTDDSTDEIP